LAQKAHTLLPSDGAVADTLGWVVYKRGDYQQALVFLQEAAAKVADNPAVQFHLGMAYYMTGQTDAARLALERVAHSSGDFPEKAEAQKRLASLQAPSAGKAETSASELEAQLKGQPNDVVLLRRLAEAHERQGDFAKSAVTYEAALKINPKLPAVATKIAQLYAGPLQNPTKAFEFAKKAREVAPNDAQTAGVLGSVAFQTGNFTWAYGLLQERVRRGPDDPKVLYDLGMTAYFLGKLSEARETIQRALNANPDPSLSTDAKRFLAMTALNDPSAEAVKARPEIEQLLQEHPDYVPALMAQAAIRVQENNLNAAAGIYSELLRKYPDFSPAQKRLAAIYADDPQNLAKAYDLAMKARKAMPSDPEAGRILGELSFKRNEFSYADQLFRESNSKQTLPAKDLYYWGLAQIQSRQQSQGRKTLEQALSAGLSEPLAGEAKKRLAEEKPKSD
jgi:tetratricopeptide (TPR) repeat protein